MKEEFSPKGLQDVQFSIKERKVKEIYSFPVNTINSLKQFYFDEYQKCYNNSIKLLDSKLKNYEHILTFQITLSRATFKTNLIQFLNDKDLMETCHPIDIIKVGCLSKERELLQLKLISLNQYNKTNINNKIIYATNDNGKKALSIETKLEPSLYIANIRIPGQIILVDIEISKSTNRFTVPLNDFCQDKDLLFNTRRSELLKLGYVVSELTEKYELNHILDEY